MIDLCYNLETTPKTQKMNTGELNGTKTTKK